MVESKKTKVGIVGLGLIGSSLAGALCKSRRYEIFGCDLSPEVTRKAITKGYIKGEMNAADTDVVILCAYLNATVKDIEKYACKMKAGAILMDVAGVKGAVISEMERVARIYKDVHYYGAHPMAGKEVQGIDNASDILFLGANALIVPLKEYGSIDTVSGIFKDAGFRNVTVTSACAHDRAVAYTSQLAHAISSCYVKSESHVFYKEYGGGSYADMTRVARLNADMWSELMCANREYLLDELDGFAQNLSRVRAAVAAGDKQLLRALLEDGNKIKTSEEPV